MSTYQEGDIVVCTRPGKRKQPGTGKIVRVMYDDKRDEPLYHVWFEGTDGPYMRKQKQIRRLTRLEQNK